MKSFLSLCAAFMLAIGACLSQQGPGHMLKLNGTNTYIDCDSVNLSHPQLTMMAWIRPNSFKSGFPYISSIMGTEVGGNNSALIRLGDAALANNKVQFVLRLPSGSGASFFKLDGISTLSTNRWQHIAAVYDGAQMRIYINGELDASMNATGTILSNAEFAIGRNYGNDRIFDGQLDEVSAWDTALTQQAIRDWMCKTLNPSHPNYANIIGYWPLDEGSGTTANDASGNGHDGSFAGSPLWQISSAPLGRTSAHDYASMPVVALAHPNGDSVRVTMGTTNAGFAHLYLIDSAANSTQVNAPLTEIDSSRHWGVFVGNNSAYALRYYYNGNSVVSGYSACYRTGAIRDNNADTVWDNEPISLVFPASSSFQIETNGQKEFCAGVSANAGLIADFAVDSVLCYSGNTGSATISVSGGTAPYSYLWSSGATGQTAAALNSTWHSVTITDDDGCIAVDSVYVPEPLPLSVAVQPTDATCFLTQDGSATATGNGGTPPFTFVWDDPASSTGNTVSDLWAGTYNVTISDANGCTAEQTVAIGSVGPDPMPNLGDDKLVCKGEVTGLSAGGSGGPFTQIQWSTGDSSAILIVSTAGTYTVTVTNAQGCTGTDVVVVDVVDPIEVSLGPNISTGTTPVILTASPSMSAYLWSTGATTPTISVNASGNYWVESTDDNGCNDRDTVKVTIWPSGISTSTLEHSLLFFPNPASDQLSVKYSSSTSFAIRFLDIIGREVFSAYVNSSNSPAQFDVSFLPDGQYIGVIKEANKPERYARFSISR